MLTPAVSATTAAEPAVDPCGQSGPARPPRRDLLERERRWMATWERYLADRRTRPVDRDRP